LTSGAPSATVDLTSLPNTYLNDPWGTPYRYVLNSTPRGFTFMSDGPDRASGTPDDLDILTVQLGGMFPLPPITPNAPQAALPAAAPSGQ